MALLRNNMRRQKDNLTSIFLFAYVDKMDMDIFVETFFTSEECMHILLYSDIDYINVKSMYMEYLKNNPSLPKTDTIKYDFSLIKYASHIYVSFYQRTYESPKTIIQYLPFSKIVENYDLYHIISDEKVIFDAKYDYSLKLNAIRKMRLDNNVKYSVSNKVDLLYFAKRIFLKLFYYPEIEQLQYNYLDSSLSFLGDSNNLMIGSIIKNVNELVDEVNKEQYRYLKYSKSNNYLFLLTKEELDITNDYLINLFQNQQFPSFNQIFLYQENSGLVKVIENRFGVTSFYINITKLDISKINIDISSRW